MGRVVCQLVARSARSRGRPPVARVVPVLVAATVPVLVTVEILLTEIVRLGTVTMCRVVLTVYPVACRVTSRDAAQRGDDVEIEQPDRRAEESLEVGASCWSVTEHQAEEPDPVKDEVAVAVRVTAAGSGVEELRDERRVLLLVPFGEALLSCILSSYTEHHYAHLAATIRAVNASDVTQRHKPSEPCRSRRVNAIVSTNGRGERGR